MVAREDTTVTLRDGRRLAYTEWGTAAGRPVLMFHGTPGCRIWCPDEMATTEADVRLILPDRPGIGRSDPLEQRTLADWTTDVLELADALDLSRFAIVGVSAGGPYAAACAALIPSRLTRLGIVSSRPLSRYNWEERPGIQAEWSADDQAEFELTRKDVVAGAKLAAANFAPYIADLERHPEGLHEALGQAEGDRWFFADANRAEIFDAYVRETWRQGVDAVAWELNAVYLPWGFRLADIPMPVHIWHGSQDPRVTTADIDFQVSTIPRSSLVTWPDSGHLGFVKHWGEILTTLTRAVDSATAT
jgi:pimeloyl-ACP methyl ester carboxylesterase